DCFFKTRAARLGPNAAAETEVVRTRRGGSDGEEKPGHTKIRKDGFAQSRARDARAKARNTSLRAFEKTSDESQTSDRDRPLGSASGRRESPQESEVDGTAADSR